MSPNSSRMASRDLFWDSRPSPWLWNLHLLWFNSLIIITTLQHKIIGLFCFTCIIFPAEWKKTSHPSRSCCFLFLTCIQGNPSDCINLGVEKKGKQGDIHTHLLTRKKGKRPLIIKRPPSSLSDPGTVWACYGICRRSDREEVFTRSICLSLSLRFSTRFKQVGTETESQRSYGVEYGHK